MHSEFTETTTLDQTEGSVTEVLHRTHIGDFHHDYYLPIFQALESNPKAPPRWNWAASLCTLNWLLFRRLWGPALIYGAILLSALLLVGGLIPLLLPGQAWLSWVLFFALFGLSFWVPGWYGNALLFKDSERKISQALSDTEGLKEACAQLTRQAPTRRQWVRQVLINLGMAGLLGLWLLYPAKPPLPVVTGTETPARQAPTRPLTEQAPPVAAGQALESATSGPLASASDASSVLSPVMPASAPSTPEPAPMPAVATSPTQGQAASVAPTSSRSADLPPPYAINVGLFSEPINARRVHSQLKAAQLPVVTTPLSTPQGRRYRVRVGPYTTQAEAQQAAQIIHALKLDAVVVQP